jgi:beta-glucosidase
MQISREYNRPIIEITVCDCCYMDAPYDNANGGILDDRRTAFFREILAELARAIADGANVRAFHAWSLMDNFEWTDGYSQRYGPPYVDFRDQMRTAKDSGLGCRRVARTNQLKARRGGAISGTVTAAKRVHLTTADQASKLAEVKTTW